MKTFDENIHILCHNKEKILVNAFLFKIFGSIIYLEVNKFEKVQGENNVGWNTTK